MTHRIRWVENGPANLLMMFAPQGWRHLEVIGRRTAIDDAQALKDLADTHVPKAKKIVLVQDKLEKAGLEISDTAG